MHGTQKTKVVMAIAPAAILKNASATATVIDCAGAAYADIAVNIGANDAGLTALKVQESDVSGSGYADIPKATYDGGKNTNGGTLALPGATGAANVIARFQIDMVGRKRYLKVVATAANVGTGAFLAGTATLSRLAVVPTLTTDLASGSVCRV